MGYWKVRSAEKFLERAVAEGVDEVVWSGVRDMRWVVAYRDGQGLGEGIVQDNEMPAIEEGLDKGVRFRKAEPNGSPKEPAPRGPRT